MASAHTTPSRKERKGIAKLWARLKALFGFKSRSSSATPAVRDDATALTPTTRPATDLIEHTTPQVQPPGTTQAAAPLTAVIPTQTALMESAMGNPRPEQSRPPLNMYATAGVIEADEDDEDTACVLFSVPNTATSTDLSRPLSRQPTGPQTQHIMTTNTGNFDRNYLKAQAVFEKYNIRLNPQDWQSCASSQTRLERVEKNARIRIHYACHRCREPFGRDRLCLRCRHKRCAECVRYPARRPVDAAIVTTEKAAVAPVAKLPISTQANVNDATPSPA